MSRKRYKKIVECIHLNDNATDAGRGNPNFDKLHKVRPLADHLNAAFQAAYQPSGELSVDESMIPFKGRSTMKQYMPMKPVKRGYKVWCLADSTNGFILKFDIYTGKAFADEQNPGNTLSERVITHLTSILKQSQCIVVFDNFFTTFKLLNMLYEDGIYSAGTVRKGRHGHCQMFEEKHKLLGGEFKYQTNGRVAATKWMDNKDVFFLSTAHNPKSVTSISRKNKDGTTSDIGGPLVAAHYNAIMGGVDRFDQLKERYEIGRRSVKWWLRILYYLLDMAIVNSFTLWKLNKRVNRNRSQMTFRLSLARLLIADFSSRKQVGRPASFLGKRHSVPDNVRMVGVGQHMPIVGKTFRRCRQCSTKEKEKRSRYTCSFCTVPLCIDSCFAKFHTP